MECPTEEELLDLVEGRMSSVSSSLETHLDRCSSCRAIVVAAAAVDPEEAAGDRYQVLEEIGRGGQSSILRVFDRELLREVALKQFLSRGDPSASSGPSPADRCLREVRVTGTLSHPAVLPIHDMGVRRSGAPFYTMPIVDGPTLAEVVSRASSVAERLRLLPHVVQVCQAIGYAHEHGFVHRDLKPENIMVGSFGETLLLDWGLARVPDLPDRAGSLPDDWDQGVTLDGSVVGTPGYMSPEQAEGGTVGPASDIWSLGAVLFFVLSGRAPFKGPSVEEILDLVRAGSAPPVRAPDGEVPPELGAIVRRAMSQALEERYPSATALADDIIAFQSGGRVSSYRYDTRERVSRFVRRYRGLLLVVAVVVAALSGIAVVSTFAYRTTREALGQAEAARNGAEVEAARHHTETVAANYKLAEAHVGAAERERDSGRTLEARRLAASALYHNPSYSGSPLHEVDLDEQQDVGPQLVARARGQLALAALDHFVGPVEVPQPTPLGATLHSTAIGGELLAIGGASHRALLLRPTDGATIATLEHDANVRDIAISASGTYALSQDEEGTVRSWEIDHGELVSERRGGTKDGVLLAVADTGALAFVNTRRSIQVVREAEAWTIDVERPSALIISGDGRTLFVGTAGGEVQVFDLSRRREVVRTRALARPINRLLYPEGTSEVIAVAAGEIARVGIEAGEVILRQQAGATVLAVALSPDHEVLYAATSREIIALSARRDRVIARIPTSMLPVHQIWRDEELLLASSGMHTQAWRINGNRPLTVDADLLPYTVQRGDVQYSVFARRPAVVRVDWEAREVQKITLDAETPVSRLALAGEHAVTRHQDRSVITWRLGADRWTPLERKSFAPVVVDAVAASEETGWVAVGTRDGLIKTWSLGRPGEIETLSGHSGPVTSLDFDPTGQYLVSSSTMPGEIMRWEVGRPSAPPVRVATDDLVVRAVCFGADTAEVYSAGDSGLRRWTIGDSSVSLEVLRPTPHRSVTYGSGLVVGQSRDFLLSTWDGPTGAPIASIDAWGHWRAPAYAFKPGERVLRVIGYSEAIELDLDAVASFDPVSALSR